MPKLSPINADKLIRVLEREGYRVTRQKGSHIIMMDAKKNRIVIPMHSGKEIKIGLLRAILKEAGIGREEFQKLLKKI
ncbi:MAG: type II toxin-antitoxin system HicA family toxin [Candidatus Bathyarchaeota archaeon]|nr:type II toxin-antitoxin system HicA family toxin [Candidatus Bathyarchaeota archaeon]